MHKTAAILLLLASSVFAQPDARRLRFEISFPVTQSGDALDGRVLLAISSDDKREPRFQIEEQEAKSQQLFGVDVDALKPGAAVVIDGSVLGYPVRSLDQLPAGDYYVQAVLNVYSTFTRADGHAVKLPPDQGEGQQWNRKPGNLYSKPVKMHVDPPAAARFGCRCRKRSRRSSLRRTPSTIRNVRIQSKLLSEFWGRPMFISAFVALPEGFDEHPGAHYPLLVEEGHFRATFDIFRTEPPAADAKDRRLPSNSTSFVSTRTGRRVAFRRVDCRHRSSDAVLRRQLRGELGQRRPLWRRHRQGADS